MNKQEEMIIDRFVRTNVRKFNKAHYPVKPSEDFTHKVMMCCMDEEKKRMKTNTLMLALVALTPFILRESWLLVRNDYFSVVNLPFGAFIYNVYHVFMSPVTFFVLLITGISAATYICIKNWKKFKTTTSFKVQMS